jgi:glucosamine-6-phosphate deaminase
MAATEIRRLLREQQAVNVIFAAAASQNEFLEALALEELPWQRVNAFHMDEYIGMPKEAPQQFGQWLKKRIFDKLPFGNIFYLDGQAQDTEAECRRYSDLLLRHPVDITCMGIGENTHLAFNDPHTADFGDKALVKVVDLDEASKAQQVAEDCFTDLSRVPSFALTLTIPALLKARTVLSMVPGSRKAQAVYHTLTGAIEPRYPSTILREHPNAYLFLDIESAAGV